MLEFFQQFNTRMKFRYTYSDIAHFLSGRNINKFMQVINFYITLAMITYTPALWKRSFLLLNTLQML